MARSPGVGRRARRPGASGHIPCWNCALNPTNAEAFAGTPEMRPPGLTEEPDHPSDEPDQAHVGGHDRLVGRVLGDQLDVAVAALEALDRRVAVDEADDDRAVAGFVLGADEDEVAVQDVSVDHAVTAVAEQEVA